MKRKIALLLAAVTAMAVAAGASQPCVEIPTVQISAIPSNNTEYGGHVTAHIAGMTPPPGMTQNGRTLFSSSHDYQEAWDDLRRQSTQINCAVNPQVGAEAARDTDTQLFSRQCTAANAAGVCTASTGIQTNRVSFVFRAVSRSGRVVWILYTAFPRRV